MDMYALATRHLAHWKYIKMVGRMSVITIGTKQLLTSSVDTWGTEMH